ncbi:HAD family hydrolase [Planobispora takensis]|uniref:Hydrolase n=1 Tax=Planobispora takensis TaxID=1367882 RepID=A0A8J3T7E0_9ACTN|nr:HAD-IA family hydrolase [Planobispora takensis]GII05478.1 hydrolase [Planobispora takensis]
MTADIAALVGGSSVILFDFDGPVCNLFAGHPASRVADTVRAALAHRGVQPPDALRDAPNPLRLLAWTGEHRTDLLPEMEDVLIAEEVRAAEKATPTAHAHEAIELACRTGRGVGIVSNNSEAAVSRYLDMHDLTRYVAVLSCRIYGHPELMKPSPEPILKAVSALGSKPSSCLFIGDAVTDMEAGIRAGTATIGYAKHPDRIPGLEGAGAGYVVDSLRHVLDALDSGGALR